MAAMGFPRDQIVVALRAASGNPDQAVDYLTVPGLHVGEGRLH